MEKHINFSKQFRRMKSLQSIGKANRILAVLATVFTAMMFFSCEEEINSPQITVLISPTYVAADKATGDVPVDPNKYSPGAELTLLGNSGNLTKAGSIFKGWTVTGSTTTYIAGDKVTIPLTHPSSTFNVTVKWAPVYTVTYNGNGSDGGSVPVDANAYEQGANVNVAPAGTLTRTGFTFAGWNTLANGTGTARAAGSTFAMASANVTLYAKWN
jgi:uncharacterized repeat protein (TIGR02543 family)